LASLFLSSRRSGFAAQLIAARLLSAAALASLDGFSIAPFPHFVCGHKFVRLKTF
jgi:hypothetical protein